mgnify:CR=1 FL=1
MRTTGMKLMVLGALLVGGAARGDTLVRDIAHLQGEHINRLMGFGLVVGLNGTGDGGKSDRTLRALAALHQRYEQNLVALDELAGDNNAAIVLVEVQTPKDGWRTGERLDVIVTALRAKSLEGGQLLATPLQVAPLPANPPPGMDRIWAIAGGGPIELNTGRVTTRGIIRGGAVMETDWHHSFIQDRTLTLVLDDPQAGFPEAQMVARALQQELASPGTGGIYERDASGRPMLQTDIAVALGPKTVRVRVPSYELAQPAAFISRVLQTPLYVRPRPPARVCINRNTRHITLTGTVRILPTVVQIPGLGTVAVGGGQGGASAGMVGVTTDEEKPVEFQQLLATLEQLKLSPDQTVHVIEQLHKTGTLQAQLIYTE